jgi:hypothetical protein
MTNVEAREIKCVLASAANGVIFGLEAIPKPEFWHSEC